MKENQQDIAENRIKAVLADKKKTCKWLANEIGLSENTGQRIFLVGKLSFKRIA